MKKIILILLCLVPAVVFAKTKAEKTCLCGFEASVDYEFYDISSATDSDKKAAKNKTNEVMVSYFPEGILTDSEKADFGDAHISFSEDFPGCNLSIYREIAKPKIFKKIILKNRCKKWSDTKIKQAKIDIQQCIDDLTKKFPGGNPTELVYYKNNYVTQPYVKNNARIIQDVWCSEIKKDYDDGNAPLE